MCAKTRMQNIDLGPVTCFILDCCSRLQSPRLELGTFTGSLMFWAPLYLLCCRPWVGVTIRFASISHLQSVFYSHRGRGQGCLDAGCKRHCHDTSNPRERVCTSKSDSSTVPRYGSRLGERMTHA